MEISVQYVQSVLNVNVIEKNRSSATVRTLLLALAYMRADGVHIIPMAALGA